MIFVHIQNRLGGQGRGGWRWILRIFSTSSCEGHSIFINIYKTFQYCWDPKMKPRSQKYHEWPNFTQAPVIQCLEDFRFLNRLLKSWCRSDSTFPFPVVFTMGEPAFHHSGYSLDLVLCIAHQVNQPPFFFAFSIETIWLDVSATRDIKIMSVRGSSVSLAFFGTCVHKYIMWTKLRWLPMLVESCLIVMPLGYHNVRLLLWIRTRSHCRVDYTWKCNKDPIPSHPSATGVCVCVQSVYVCVCVCVCVWSFLKLLQDTIQVLCTIKKWQLSLSDETSDLLCFCSGHMQS